MPRPALSTVAPKITPPATATTIGWAHPTTGEQMISTRGLAHPVAYYKPNARTKAFTGGPVVPAAPTNTTPASITGTAKEGSVLTTTPGVWAGEPAPVVTRKWYRNASVISGATALTYTLTATDVGKVIKVTESATNSEGTATASSPATETVIA